MLRFDFACLQEQFVEVLCTGQRIHKELLADGLQVL